MQYISPLVFSSISLLDPAITAIISWLIRLEHLPSLFSWLGGSIVIGGVGIISYGEGARSPNPNHDPVSQSLQDEIALSKTDQSDLSSNDDFEAAECLFNASHD